MRTDDSSEFRSRVRDRPCACGVTELGGDLVCEVRAAPPVTV